MYVYQEKKVGSEKFSHINQYCFYANLFPLLTSFRHRFDTTAADQIKILHILKFSFKFSQISFKEKRCFVNDV